MACIGIFIYILRPALHFYMQDQNPFVFLTVSPGFIVGNVLLLRNQLNLSPDISEVSQEKLLSLVADRLIDADSNVNVNTSFCSASWICSC